eukprot:TRINITY_DN43681_c0_g1_i1.p1 TRINITY_DN43681_c0_g1~~TRINITY_DN43681_c0_g1_i1.p1  ORF type:complete len:381 (-),score=58.65 TRINITY_DN43681_c0_g1_i1:59-1201(-)
MPEQFNLSLSKEEFNASLTRPKLDSTLVLDKTLDHNLPEDKQQSALFTLASLNTRTAPSAAVCWSQLLALSLAPESEPVLSVGRHKTCGIRLVDPRASVNHFDIVARKASCKDDCAPGAMDELSYECFLNDRSSNGTAVNGAIVGKGNSKQLRTGDEISVLPASRVGVDEMIAFLFRNTTENLHTQEGVEALASEMEELVVCPICIQAIYKCVALTPCSHNFCMACCSDWMRRKNDCPVCRRPITAVMKNHPMDAVIEAFLMAYPERRRSIEDLRLMDARDELKLGSSGKLVRNVCTVVTQGGSGSGSPPRPAASNSPPRRAAPGSGPTAGATFPPAAQAPASAGNAGTPGAASLASPARPPNSGAAEYRNLGSQVCILQ